MRCLYSHDQKRITIRNARISDIDALKRIEDKSFKYPYSKHLLLYLLNTCDVFLVAVTGDPEGVVGYICGSIEIRRGVELGHIISIAVDPSYRRKGIGRRLMEEVIEFYKRRGISVIYLECRVSNKVAQRFYEKLGFRKECIIKGYYENGEDAIVYKKDLSKI